MKIHHIIILLSIFLFASCQDATQKGAAALKDGQVIEMEKQVLFDKVKGGWAGQAIGCVYGGPTEFRWRGSMINARVPIPWDEDQFELWFDNGPQLFDDIYMDLTFVSVFEEHGLDASDTLHALAFANAGYYLWHANQAARYNILHGIMPPESGHWKNNPHADDIDYQIESDFAGIMSPGMINAASEISDKIGHIMNYGDGWYGGVFVGGMYTQAFVSNDIKFIVTEALKAIPAESRFHQTIEDVIQWHEMYPDDWRRTWFETQRKWSHDKGCPDGVFTPFNIDASINAAAIVIGLLYGEGDFGKTIDISTRAGDDSDCNPSNAAGILGTMLGFSNIPEYWKQGMSRVEQRNFSYTELSLLDVYDISFKQALEMIERNGGAVKDETVEIKYQKVETVRFEEAFPGLFPLEKIAFDGWPRPRKMINNDTREFSLTFNGAGFVISANAYKTNQTLPDYDLKADVFINGEYVETAIMPTNPMRRKLDICWNYDLPEKDHEVKIVVNDIPPGYQISLSHALIYSKSDPGTREF